MLLPCYILYPNLLLYIIYFLFGKLTMTYYSSQIIQTLSQQIKSLTPLRQSFRILHNYYLQLSDDLENLILSTNCSENELACQFKYLLDVRNQLESEFVECGQKLKYLESKCAKCEMEKSENIAQNEALKSRKELQEQQRRNLQDKGKDLIEQNKKLGFNISKLKEIIHKVELVVKSKNYENQDIQREIKKLELVNSKISQLNRDAEQNTTQRQDQNERTVELLSELDSKLDSYEKIIQTKTKQNKENSQTLIAKKQECDQLKHRKEYLQKLIQTQLSDQRQLSKAYGELDTMLTVKRQKLELLREQNREYQALIDKQKDKISINNEEYLRLKKYLQTLIQSNEVLFKQLEKSCTQDKHVQILLTEKLEKLLVVNDKLAENDFQNRRRICLNQNVPSLSYERQSPLSKNSVNIQTFKSKKYNVQDKICDPRKSLAGNRQTHSSWGSNLKENRRYDL